MKKQRTYFFLTVTLSFIIVSTILIAAQEILEDPSEQIIHENIIHLKNSDPRQVKFPSDAYHARHRASYEKQLLFDATYGIDRWGRRQNPRNTEEAKKSLAIFGCSMVFGSGLSDEETLASKLSENLNQTFVTTYAFPGDGPQNVLINLLKRDFEKELPITPATFIYIALVDSASGHPERFTGSVLIDDVWSDELPFIAFDSNETAILTDRSILKNMDGWQRLRHKVLSSSFIRPMLKKPWTENLIGVSQEKTKMRFIKAVVAMEKISKSKGHHFHLVFHPMSASEIVSEYISLFQNITDVSIIQTRGAYYHRPKYLIPYDRHPTEEFNREFAKELAQNIPTREF